MKHGVNFKLIVPPSPQIPTPGREFLLKTPIEGTSYIATVMEDAGYDVEIIDYRTQNKPIEEIVKDNNVIIGISTFIDAFGFLEDFTKKVKEKDKDIPIILGGPFVSSAPQILLRNLSADYAVLGEGELTILELSDALAKQDNSAVNRIAGICYRQNGKVISNPDRPQMMNLDILPLLDLKLWPTVKNNPYLERIGFSSTRGCYSKCSFCFKIMRKVRQMSPERFGEEVRSFVEKHSLKYAFINDLTFVLGRKRTLKMCDELKQSGIRWACSTRVENIDDELLGMMKDSGCEEIWYGFESVDQKVLDTNFKAITVEQIENAVKVTNKAGIKVMGNFIIGLLGETEESLDKMVEFIETKDVIPCSIKYLTPFPGTYIYDYALGKGLIKNEIEYFRALSRRKVNDVEDEIVNCTSLPEEKLREAFKKIRKISYERYGDLDWNIAK